VLFFLNIAVFFVVIVTWFVILFTGRYPQGIFGFVEGVFRCTTASPPMRSSWSRIGTRPSGWPQDRTSEQPSPAAAGPYAVRRTAPRRR
jgi:Domain of unknown function (DUF4389)